MLYSPADLQCTASLIKLLCPAAAVCCCALALLSEASPAQGIQKMLMSTTSHKTLMYNCTLLSQCFEALQRRCRVWCLFSQEGVLCCAQADDRLLVVSEAATGSPSSLFGPEPSESQQQAGPQLRVQHIKVPQQYMSARYPLTHAAISPDGMDVAVAGTLGLGLYSRRSSRWRLFGDVSQEREILVQVHCIHAPAATPVYACVSDALWCCVSDVLCCCAAACK